MLAPPFIVLPVIPREVVASGPLAVAVLLRLRLKIDVAALVDSEDLNPRVWVGEALIALPLVLIVGSTARTVRVLGSMK
jgi:hypothetical protein